MIHPCTDDDIAAIEAVVNDAAERYRGVIPSDCWHDPYMPHSELLHEIVAGVRFWAWQEESGSLAGVMGIQTVHDATLIRHAYVSRAYQGRGIGSTLLSRLLGHATGQVMVGTWAAAEWAIRFYQRHGFGLLSAAEKDQMLKTYWTISARQRETSVVLRHGK